MSFRRWSMRRRTPFTRPFLAASLIALTAMPSGRLWAQEHLVDSTARDARLAGLATTRARDVTAIVTLLDSEPAARVARVLGLDTEHAPARLALLTDAELHDLARRSQALRVDPSAGMSSTGKVWLVIGIVVVVVTAVAFAVWVGSCSHTDCTF